METQDETEMAAGVGTIYEPVFLKMSLLKLEDWLEGRGWWYWEGMTDVNGIQIGGQQSFSV